MMKKFLAILFAFTVYQCAFTKNATSCLTGVQKPKFECASVIDFVVVDLFTLVSRKDVVHAIKAVETQAKKDFAPKWGVSARFELLPRGVIPTITDNRKVIVYLVDALQNLNSWGAGVTSNHYIVQPSPNDFDGPQPNFFIPAVGTVPNGTPVIIVPFGNTTFPYGLSLGFTPETEVLYGIPFFTPLQILSFVLSHETLESLADTFDGFTFLGAYQILTPGATQTLAYIREVVDPVTYGGFNLYCRKGTYVANFVLPDYFNPYPNPSTCLDFLGNVKQPFTPFGGYQSGYVINCTGEFDSAFYLSLPSDPTNIETFLTPIYPPCAPMKASLASLPKRARGYLPVLKNKN